MKNAKGTNYWRNRIMKVAKGYSGDDGMKFAISNKDDFLQEVQEFGMPFGGMIDASENWFADPIRLAVIAAVVVVMPLLVVRAFQRPNPMAWGALGFVLLAILMTRQVWWNFFDISRAIAPVMTAYLVTAFSEPPRTRDGAASPS